MLIVLIIVVDLVMSHVDQIETIKITNREIGILPNNVPVVDQFLNNYRTHKASTTHSVASNSPLMNITNSMHVHRVEDSPYTQPTRKLH